jgi:gliding motility-associated-like protein
MYARTLNNLDYFKTDSNIIRIQITVKNVGNKISDSVSLHLKIPEDQFKLNGNPAPDILELSIANSLRPGEARQRTETLIFNKPGSTEGLEAKVVCENNSTPVESNLYQDIVIRPNPFNVSLEFIKTEDKNFVTDRKDPLNFSVYAKGNEMLYYTLRASNIGDSVAKNIEIAYNLNPRYLTLSKTDMGNSPNPSIGAATISNNVLHWTISWLDKGETADLDMVVSPLLSSKNVNSAKITVNDGIAVSNVWDEDDFSDNSATTAIEIFPIVKKWAVMQSFSPNGDGLNDLFVIQELNDPRFADNELTIFNRYGTEVFRAKPYTNNWDATGLPDGTYFYKLIINLENGQKQEKASYITIRRSRKK